MTKPARTHKAMTVRSSSILTVWGHPDDPSDKERQIEVPLIDLVDVGTPIVGEDDTAEGEDMILIDQVVIVVGAGPSPVLPAR